MGVALEAGLSKNVSLAFEQLALSTQTVDVVLAVSTGPRRIRPSNPIYRLQVRR